MGRKRIKQLTHWDAWTHILRLSNAPTVISNVMVGLALAIQSHRIEFSNLSNPPPFNFIKPIIIVSVALLCLYFAGMVLNDAIDAKRDRKLRPERPIPQGVISTRVASVTGIILIAVSLFLSWRLQPQTVMYTGILGGTVIAYTLLHRFLLPAIVLMGGCRALVYIVAFSAFFSVIPEQLVTYCAAVGIYTCLLTFIGKSEHIKTANPAIAVILMLLPAIVPAFMYGDQFSLHWLILGLFVAWTCIALWLFSIQHQPIKGMHVLLSGFCLLDCVFLATMQEYSIMIVSFICFVFTVAMHRKILGT